MPVDFVNGEQSAAVRVHECEMSSEGVGDDNPRTSWQNTLTTRRERQADAVQDSRRRGVRGQRRQIHYLHAARPQRGHGRPFAVRQHRDTDRIRGDGQTSLEVQACTVEREDDQLMPFVIHDQDVLAIGQDGEIVQVFADAPISSRTRLCRISTRDTVPLRWLATHSVRPSSTNAAAIGRRSGARGSGS